jgi:hypothetical protein
MNQPPPHGGQPPYQQPPPYGGPPGQPQYAQPMMPPPRSGGSGMSIMMMIRLGVAGVAILFAVGVFGWMKLKMGRDSKPHIMFENSTSSAVDLTIDGKSMGNIPAGGGKVLTVDPGEHDVVAGTDKGHISVPATDSFRGLYAVGGKSLVAVVTVHYAESGSSPFKDTVEPVDFKGGRLATLSGLTPENMELDKPFPEQVSVNQGSLGTSRIQLCHIHDVEDDYVGCANF